MSVALAVGLWLLKWAWTKLVVGVILAGVRWLISCAQAIRIALLVWRLRRAKQRLALLEKKARALEWKADHPVTDADLRDTLGMHDNGIVHIQTDDPQPPGDERAGEGGPMRRD